MTEFEKWHTAQNLPYESDQCPHIEWERKAWHVAQLGMRERCAKEIEITGTQWGGKDWNTAITKCAAAVRALEVT
jgi:hypothetical protein